LMRTGLDFFRIDIQPPSSPAARPAPRHDQLHNT